jgi:hypothetical protein
MHARFRSVDPSLERPREVAGNFVADVAEALANSADITRLIPSRREIQVKRDDLTYAYYFQSSSNNTAGATVVLLPHAVVRSQTLRLWRRGRPWARAFGRETSIKRPDDGLFVGGMLGNFFWPRRYIALEIVDPADREGLLKHIVEEIRGVDARLQPNLRNFDAFLAYATREDTDIECMADNACEYIAAHWGIDAVGQYVSALANSIPNGQDQFRKAFTILSADPNTGERIIWRVKYAVLFLLTHNLAPKF